MATSRPYKWAKQIMAIMIDSQIHQKECDCKFNAILGIMCMPYAAVLIGKYCSGNDSSNGIFAFLAIAPISWLFSRSLAHLMDIATLKVIKSRISLELLTMEVDKASAHSFHEYFKTIPQQIERAPFLRWCTVTGSFTSGCKLLYSSFIEQFGRSPENSSYLPATRNIQTVDVGRLGVPHQPARFERSAAPFKNDF